MVVKRLHIMNQKKTEELLEQLNLEYLQLSRMNELTYGFFTIRILYALKNVDCKLFINTCSQIIKFRKIRKLSYNRADNKPFIYSSNSGTVSPNECVVYTCVTGGYDQIMQEPLTKRHQFIYFTDEERKSNSDYWTVTPVENLKWKGNQINRYYKLHPSEFLQPYRYSMYIDGDVQIISDITPFFDAAKESKYGIAMHAHSDRNCVYKEAQACILLRRGDKDAILKQTEQYRKDGFPENFGMCMAKMIVIDNENPYSKIILDAWWDEFIRSKSGRDQLSFPYVIWKMGYKIEDFAILGNNIYLNPKIRVRNLGKHKG